MLSRKIGVSISVLMILALFSGSMGQTIGPKPPTDDMTIRYSFDFDGDKIDDRMDPSSNNPLWTFVHVAKGYSSNEVESQLARLGCDLGKPFTYFNVIPARFQDHGVIVTASLLSSISVIELDTGFEMAIHTSAKAMKVEPSNVYSPHTAHDLGFYGEGLTVAILDLGIDNEHPTLRGSFVAGADFSKPESPTHPRDGSYDPDDHNGHGTAVASVLAGRGENGENVGMAPRAGIIDLKMSDLNPAYQNNMAEAMQWCLDHKNTDWGNGHVGIDVISMSALTDTSPDSALGQLQSLIAQSGIPFIQAAGNDGVKQGERPATYWWSDDVIIAGGLDDRRTVDRTDDKYWDEATYGPRESDGDDDPYDELKPDVVATATNLTLATGASSGNAEGWGVFEGTSYATPHVSGIVTLILDANPSIANLGGKKVLETIREILHDTAEARGIPYDPSLSKKYSQKYGYGIVDGYKAVKAALEIKDENKPPQILELDIEHEEMDIGTTIDVSVRATDPNGDPLTYELTADGGDISGSGPSWTWTAPDEAGTYTLIATVHDPSGLSASELGKVVVEDGTQEEPTVKDNELPVIQSFWSSKLVLEIEEKASLSVMAYDPDGDSLSYSYSTTKGWVVGNGATATFTAPTSSGEATVTVRVTDDDGEEDEASLRLTIQDIGKAEAPPIVRSVELDPYVFNKGEKDKKATLTAFVIETEADIDTVYADLSPIGGKRKVALGYSGTAQGKETELVYDLDIEDMDNIRPGSYFIEVGCVDVDGNEASPQTVTLIIIKDPSDDVGDEGQLMGYDILLPGALILALILVSTILAYSRRSG